MFKKKQISFTDSPTAQDKFGIGKYITGLSNFIKKCEAPLTIAVQGDWGTGKTSIIYQVRNILEREGIKSIFFNTWQYSQFDMDTHLPISLIYDLTREISSEKDKSVKEFLANIASLLTRSVAYSDLPYLNMEKISDDLTDKVKDTFEKNDNIKSLVENWNKIVEDSLKNEKYKKIVIFIDDLDRLVPSRAVEILEVLKLFLESKNCVFVLAIDYDVIVTGVKNKYGDDVDSAKGRAFFDKLIQVPFTVPVAHYNIENYIRDSINNLNLTNTKWDEATIKRQIIPLIKYSIGTNPRSINRLLNSFSLLLNIFEDATKDKSNRELMLFALVCMQYAYENQYLQLVESLKEDFPPRKDVIKGIIKKYKQEGNDLVDEFQNFMQILEELISNDTDDTTFIQLFDMSETVSTGNLNKKQNHSPNEDVQYVIRKLFNKMTTGQGFSLDEPTLFGTEKKEDRISNKVEIENISKLELTRGKGQGIYIYFRGSDKKQAIYFSGDTYGNWTGPMLDGVDIQSSELKDFPAAELRDNEDKFEAFYEKLMEKIKEVIDKDNKN
ncbi:KAP family P-loop NTPase fold protein [Streptococcus marmotae]|uniref:KAP family P-loop NTPase fold protein n=1 Tax=Streptococcus marmotae TaxID=1825069 RepID=UPI00082DDA51|nr:P-loop NTPase fold protein [Streptococcus marmotae]